MEDTDKDTDRVPPLKKAKHIEYSHLFLLIDAASSIGDMNSSIGDVATSSIGDVPTSSIGNVITSIGDVPTSIGDVITSIEDVATSSIGDNIDDDEGTIPIMPPVCEMYTLLIHITNIYEQYIIKIIFCTSRLPYMTLAQVSAATTLIRIVDNYVDKGYSRSLRAEITNTKNLPEFVPKNITKFMKSLYTYSISAQIIILLFICKCNLGDTYANCFNGVYDDYSITDLLLSYNSNLPSDYNVFTEIENATLAKFVHRILLFFKISNEANNSFTRHIKNSFSGNRSIFVLAIFVLMGCEVREYDFKINSNVKSYRLVNYLLQLKIWQQELQMPN